MKTITVDNIKYISEADVKAQLSKKGVKPTKIQIVVLQRGWVAIGRYSQDKDGCHLTNASIIRTWGTTKGLGELAMEGVKTNTKMDKCPDIHYHPMTAVYNMDVNEEVWNKIIN